MYPRRLLSKGDKLNFNDIKMQRRGEKGKYFQKQKDAYKQRCPSLSMLVRGTGQVSCQRTVEKEKVIKQGRCCVLKLGLCICMRKEEAFILSSLGGRELNQTGLLRVMSHLPKSAQGISYLLS